MSFIKRLFLTTLIITLFFNFCVSAANYPNYLYDNPNYKLAYAHMDHATYLDTSSVVLKSLSSKGLLFAEIVVPVDFKYNHHTNEEIIDTVHTPMTVLFYRPFFSQYQGFSEIYKGMIVPPYVSDVHAYISYDDGANWTVFNTQDTHGYNLSLYRWYWMGISGLRGQ